MSILCGVFANLFICLLLLNNFRVIFKVKVNQCSLELVDLDAVLEEKQVHVLGLNSHDDWLQLLGILNLCSCLLDLSLSHRLHL